MSWLTGASDALQQALIDEQVRRRQAMLDQFSLDDRRERAMDRRQGRKIQDENLSSLKEQRTAAAEKSKQDRAKGVAELLSPDAELDANTEQVLADGGLSALVKKTPITTSVQATEGLGAATPDNPLGLDTTTKNPLKVDGGRSVFGGTAKQVEEARKRAARAEYIKGLPPSEMKTYLEAQDATGDNSLPPALAVPPKPQPKQVIGSSRTGYFQLNPDGSKTMVVPPAPDKAPAPHAPQIFVGDDGKPRAIQFGPNGQAIEVPLPPGIAGRTAPPKTPATIEAEAAARAKGTATGKAQAPSAPGIFDRITAFLKPSTAHAPAAGGAAPKQGEVKTFPNGRKAVWDGTGWVAQ